jgi:hypothetical protein
MEPHREEPHKALPPSAERKPKRFRIVKLEERIAPNSGGSNGRGCYTNDHTNCGYTCGYCTWTCRCP